MKLKKNLFGFVLQSYLHGDKSPHTITRDDGKSESSDTGVYFDEKASPLEFAATKWVKGKVLDVGCGAGRHALYFQKHGNSVVCIDADALCVKTCKERGIKHVFKENILKPNKIKKFSFDTVWFGGNNLGVTGKLKNLPILFKILDKITTPNGIVVAAGIDFTVGAKGVHKKYLLQNKKKGIYPGTLKLRVEYKDYIGEWFPWLLVSLKILRSTLFKTPWKIAKVLRQNNGRYVVLIRKQF